MKKKKQVIVKLQRVIYDNQKIDKTVMNVKKSFEEIEKILNGKFL